MSQFINRLLRLSIPQASNAKIVIVGVISGLLSTQAYAALEEVVITAQKKAQSINDVSLSVNAVQGDRMRELGLDDAIELDIILTNVDIKSTISGDVNPIVSIRGVGLNSAASNNNPSVGIYVDEVFLASPAMLSMFMMDIDRVEALKGPQGTLYGRNSSGGAINIHSALPTEEPSGFAELSGGDYDTVKFEGAYSQGLTENVAGRISVLYENQGDSYYTNTTTGDELDGIEKFGIRGTLQGSFENTEATLKVFYFDSEGSNAIAETVGTAAGPFSPFCAAANTVLAGNGDELSPGICTDIIGGGDTDRDRFTNSLTPANEERNTIDTDLTGVNLKIEHDFSDSLTLTSVTGYMTQDRVFGDGADILFIVHDEEMEQWSQELRLSGNVGSHSFILGGFYSNDTAEMFNPFTSPFTLAALGVDPLFHYVDQETDAYALFASVDWTLTDQFTLTTGIRYTYEEQSFVGGTTALFPIPGGPLSTVEAVLADRDLALNAPGAGLGVPLTFTDDEIDETDVSFRAALEYRPDEDKLFYASISTAFKSGGFYGDFTTSQDQLVPFDSEQIMAYEIGTKLTLFSGLVQANGAVFYYDYEDIQAQVPGTFSFLYRNVEEADIYGLDLEIFASPTDNLDLRFGFGYIDTELSSSIAAIDGNEMSNAPEVQVTGGARYQFPVANSWIGAVEGDFKYSDDKFTESFNIPLNYTDSYLTVNGRISLAQENGPWEVAFFVRNITDEDNREEAFNVDLINTIFTFPTAPRTFGGSISYEF